MATKQKDSSHGKEKIGTSTLHHHIDSSHGRSPRTPKSTIPGSPEKVNHGVISDKPTPNYLKHTLSSSKEPSSRLGKKSSNSDDNSPRFTRRKSFDKPPSPSQLQRTLSSNSRDKSTPTKPSSPSPRTTISPKSEKSAIRSPKPVSERVIVPQKIASERISISHKTASDRTSKTPRNVKTVHPVSTKPKPLRRTSSNTSSKNGAKASPAPSVASSTAPTSPEANETPAGFEVEPEDKIILEQEVLEQEALKIEEEEIPFEGPPDPDQVLTNHHIDFSEGLKKDSFIEKSKSFDTTPTVLVEQVHEEVILPTSQIEETTQEKTIEPVEDENQHEVEKEQVMIFINEDKKSIEESSERQFQNNSLAFESQDEAGTEVSTEAKGDDKTIMKSTMELEVDSEAEGTQKLKFKEREVVEEEEEKEEDEAAKAEAEKLSLRRQEVNKGKKESQAYNDVIEETASKLVQKRKSKVLALVGGFETVISLQEPKGQ